MCRCAKIQYKREEKKARKSEQLEISYFKTSERICRFWDLDNHALQSVQVMGFKAGHPKMFHFGVLIILK